MDDAEKSRTETIVTKTAQWSLDRIPVGIDAKGRITIDLRDEHGFGSVADISPETARRFARRMLELADVAEGGPKREESTKP